MRVTQISIIHKSLDTRIFRKQCRASASPALIAEHLTGSGDHPYKISMLLQLELWFRTYVDRAPTEDPVALPIG